MEWWQYCILAIPALPNIWALWHIFTHVFSTPQERLFWIMFNALFPIIGGVIYFFFGRRRATSTYAEYMRKNTLQ